MAAVVATTFLASPARSESFSLIRNARNAHTLSRAQVRELALGRKKTWPHGAVAVLVLPRAGTPEMGWFASSIVGLTESALLSRIKEQVFRGEMRKPITVATEQELLTAVAADDGTIGVVRTEATKNLPAGVAVLTLQ
jgi:hypothetical protein